MVTVTSTSDLPLRGTVNVPIWTRQCADDGDPTGCYNNLHAKLFECFKLYPPVAAWSDENLDKPIGEGELEYKGDDDVRY